MRRYRTTLTRDSFTVTCADEIRGLGPVSDLTIGHVKRRESKSFWNKRTRMKC